MAKEKVKKTKKVGNATITYNSNKIEVDYTKLTQDEKLNLILEKLESR